MKKWICCLLIMLLIVPLASAEETRYECGGFDSPEDAALAYGEAFARGDVMGMISTFAVETYVDHFDSEEYLKYYRSYSITRADAMLPLPYSDGYAWQLRVMDRVSSLLDGFDRQYLVMSGMEKVEATFENKGMGFITFASDDQEMLDAFLDLAKNSVWPGDVTVGAALGRDVSSRIDWGKGYDRSIASLCAYAGSDEAATVAVTLRIDGVDYLQLMLCVRYGDRWYNQSLGGFAASYLTIRFDAFRDYQYACGLIPAEGALELLSSLGI